MRVLLYNWIPLYDKTGRGAGVDVYVKNLINSLGRQENVDLFYLSSGTCYDDSKKIFYIKVADEYDQIKCAQFTIVNSPVFAPASLSFLQVRTLLEDKNLSTVFTDFLQKNGPFDVVHFHNLEGLTIECLNVKNKFKNTKFIYTIHNYYPFCPQVQLWSNGQNSCTKNDTDIDCLSCRKYHYTSEDKMIKKMSLQFKCFLGDIVERGIEKQFELLDRQYSEVESEITEDELRCSLSGCYERYRKAYINIINQNIDNVLVVSKRVGDIAINMGIRNSIVDVLYIGSSSATKERMEIEKKYDSGEALTIVYLGYARKEKGYYFFCDLLNAIPLAICKKIKIIIAARGMNEADFENVREKFCSFHIQNGYDRDKLPQFLSQVDLGIVPVLWEDNLPQVAIELAANGVAVLSSDLGGASELCDDGFFRFKAGNIKDCAWRIEKIVQERSILNQYWNSYKEVNDSQQHVLALMNLYSTRNCSSAQIQMRDYENIYIFGAQSRAKTLTGYIHELYPHIEIMAYLVDDVSENENSILGVPVCALSDVLLKKNSPILIATKGVFHKDIFNRLLELQFSEIVPITVDIDNYFRNEYVKKIYEKQKIKFIKIDDIFVDCCKSHQTGGIYVAKSIYDKPLETEYQMPCYEKAIQVGAALTEKRLMDFSGRYLLLDNVGDNISDKNRQYSELTALYWIWKHLDADILGLVHYRRHFILPENWMEIMYQEKIDVILPVPTCVLPSISENYRERHDASDWDYLLKYLSENCMEYFMYVSDVFDGTLYYPCNMLIAKKDVLNELCEWMFPILDAVVNHGGNKEDIYQNRYAGFISERLITLFFRAHQDRYKIVYADRIFLR